MKHLWLKWTNGFLLVSFAVQASTGVWLLLADLLKKEPPEAVDVLHAWNGLGFVVLAVIHVILNWAWLRVNFFKRSVARTVQ